jgi:AraC-like DNA-binding protein
VPDPDFGLHTAESLKPGAFDALDYAVRSAPTLKVALERLLRYSRLTPEPAIFRMSSGSSTIHIEHCFGPGSDLPCRQEAEFTLASIVVIGGQIVDGGFKPVRVEFMHAKPVETGEHARIFGVLPGFSSKVNSLEIDRAMLDRQLITADTLLSRIIEGHAEDLLNAIASESVTEELRAALTRLLPQGRCTISAVAPMARMSERTLQRKLEREDTTFAKVPDDLRHDLGLRSLKEGRVWLAEIAYLLGYAEPSPFHRAF